MTLTSDANVRPLTHQTLQDVLDECVSDHVITAEQAALITAHAGTGPPVQSRSLAAEALGYVGGAVIVAATLLIAAEYWGEMPLGARLVTLGGAATALIAGGTLVPAHPGPGARLRTVLWLAALPAVAGFLGVLGDEALDLGEKNLAVLATAGAASTALLLWWGHRTFVQQAGAMVALMATAAAVTSRATDTDRLPPAGAWLVAAAWLVLGERGVLTPRRAILPLGSAAAIVTSATVVDIGWGLALVLGSLATVLVLAMVEADLVLLAVGAVGTLMTLPAVMGQWFPDSRVMPFVLLGVGLLLVMAALRTARRRRRTQPDAALPRTRGEH